VRLSEHLRPEHVLISPAVAGRDELFGLFAQRLADSGLVPTATEVVERLLEREAILSTAIGGGVAVPHAQIEGLDRLLLTASTHSQGLDYPALDSRPVRLVFCLLGGAVTAAHHIAGLARLARLARSGETLEQLIAASSGDAFVATLARLEGG
jgi:nitrogen PTS system EIIA component